MNRTIAPEYSQTTSLDIVSPEKMELQNGVMLFWMKDVKDDSVKLEISWRGGSKYQNKTLSASFTNKLLLSGTSSKNSRQIAEEIDFFGGYVQPEIDKDHAGFNIFGLKENISKIFSVFADAFGNAVFPEDELRKDLDIAASKFKVEEKKVKFLARRAFIHNLFGEESQYGRLSQIEDFDQLQQDDLKSFYSKIYRKAPVIFLTGNVDQSFINELTEWSGSFEKDDNPSLVQKFEQFLGHVDVDRDDAVQVALRMGGLMFKKDHEDYYDFQVLNTILGGYFGSRLMANLREDKGFTYGVGSGMAVLEDTGYFFITTEVKKEIYVEASRQISIELKRLREDLVPDDELSKVKNYMLGEFLRQADGPISMMEIHKNLFYNRLPDSYYQDFIQSILDVKSDRLRDLAIKYLDRSETFLNVAAGT